MPTYRPPSDEVDELQLPTQPECKVWMKRHVIRGDILDAQEYVLNTQRAGNEKAIGMSTNFRVAFVEALTLALITDWNLEDDNGKWPFEFASLRRLHGRDGTFLEAEANRRIEGPSGPFDSPSGQPSTDMRSTTTTSMPSWTSTTGGEPEDGRPTSSDANGSVTLKVSGSSISTAGN